MAIFKKIIFGLNVVGPQGVNAINDFVIGETTDGKTAILVGDQIIKTGGLEYVDDEGTVHEVPSLPSLPTNTTKYYKLVEHNKTLSWAETTGLDIPALPADIGSKTYSLETTSSGMAWVEKSSGGDASITAYIHTTDTADAKFFVKINNVTYRMDQNADVEYDTALVSVKPGDVIQIDPDKSGDVHCTITAVVNGTATETSYTEGEQSYTVLAGTTMLNIINIKS